MKSVLNLMIAMILIGPAAFARSSSQTAQQANSDLVDRQKVGEVEIVTPISESPLVILGVSALTDSYTYFDSLVLKDVSNQGRLYITVYNNQSKGAISYYNSAGQLKGSYSVDDKTARALFQKLSGATQRCPITVEISRETLRVQKIKLSCDDLAAAQAEDNAG